MRGTGNSNVFWDNLYGHHYNYAYSNDFDRREVKLIPDVSQALAWLEKNPQALQGIQRGLERETLRVNADGSLATTGHPQALGSALTHKWITTDFAEARWSLLRRLMATFSICSPLCAMFIAIPLASWAMSGCGH